MVWSRFEARKGVGAIGDSAVRHSETETVCPSARARRNTRPNSLGRKAGTPQQICPLSTIRIYRQLSSMG